MCCTAAWMRASMMMEHSTRQPVCLGGPLRRRLKAARGSLSLEARAASTLPRFAQIGDLLLPTRLLKSRASDCIDLPAQFVLEHMH
jgi:hypothetical protein